MYAPGILGIQQRRTLGSGTLLTLVLRSPSKCHQAVVYELKTDYLPFRFQSPNLRQAFSQLTTSPNIPHKLFPAGSHFFSFFDADLFFFYLLNLLQYCFCYIPFVFLAMRHVRSQFPNQGSNPHLPSHWKAKS